MGRPGGETLPQRSPAAGGSVPPEGAVSSWGGPAVKLAPTLPHCVWVAAPRGGFFTLGRPGGETGPHAPLLCMGRCPRGDYFPLERLREKLPGLFSDGRRSALVYNLRFYATSTPGFELRNGLPKDPTRLAQLMEKI